MLQWHHRCFERRLLGFESCPRKVNLVVIFNGITSFSIKMFYIEKITYRYIWNSTKIKKKRYFARRNHLYTYYISSERICKFWAIKPRRPAFRWLRRWRRSVMINPILENMRSHGTELTIIQSAFLAKIERRGYRSWRAFHHCKGSSCLPIVGSVRYDSTSRRDPAQIKADWLAIARFSSRRSKIDLGRSLDDNSTTASSMPSLLSSSRDAFRNSSPSMIKKDSIRNRERELKLIYLLPLELLRHSEAQHFGNGDLV